MTGKKSFLPAFGRRNAAYSCPGRLAQSLGGNQLTIVACGRIFIVDTEL